MYAHKTIIIFVERLLIDYVPVGVKVGIASRDQMA